MNSTYTDRLAIEQRKLAEKLGKLNIFLHSDDIGTLSDEDISLLEIQYSCMEGYYKVVTRRLAKTGFFDSKIDEDEIDESN